MDVQRGIVDRLAEDPAYIRRLRRAVDAAHTAGTPVIYVVIGFRPGHPEVSPRNKTFAQLAKSARGTAFGFTEGDPGADVHPDVAPGPHDLIVTKKRVSAFTGSDLETVLRAADIDSLVLTGMATSGVVLSTLRQAADLDFGLTVLEDGCLDGDPEIHRVLTQKVFPGQAEVVTVDDWVKTVVG
jgi:nicotinamidase-related amidase